MFLRKAYLISIFLFSLFPLVGSFSQEKPLHAQISKLLQDRYYAPPRFVSQQFLAASCRKMQAILPGLEITLSAETATIHWESESKGSFALSLNSIAETLATTDALVRHISHFLKSPEKVLFQDAYFEILQEGLKTLDPHTKLYSPEQTYAFLQKNQNRQFGVGFVMVQEEEKVLIQSVWENSPAERAGVSEGDLLLEVNGILLPGPNIRQLQKQIEQADGKVDITVEKAGTGAIQRYSLHKQELATRVVESYLLNGEVGYFRIHRFSEKCFDQFLTQLRGLESGRGSFFLAEGNQWKKEVDTGESLKIQSYIIDLRGNPGGLLKEAVRFCDYFLNVNKPLVTVKRSKGEEEVYTDTKGGNTQTPLFILIDAGSASAAEIMAGCLQKYKRALVLGLPSFGKGSVQEGELLEGKDLWGHEVNPLFKMSIAEYFVADKEPIQNRGVVPNIELIQAEITLGRIRLAPPAFLRERDLLTHLESQDTIKRIDSSSYDRIVFADKQGTVIGKPDEVVALCARLLKGDGPFEGDDWKNTEFYARKKDKIRVLKTEENQKITQLLGQQGIPWESGGEYSANLKAELELVNLGETIYGVAGQTLKMKLGIRNKSNIPAFGVMCTLELESQPQQTFYAFWGTIQGQKTQEAYVEIPIKKEWAGTITSLRFVVQNENGENFRLARKFSVPLAEPRQIAIQYRIEPLEEADKKNSKGDNKEENKEENEKGEDANEEENKEEWLHRRVRVRLLNRGDLASKQNEISLLYSRKEVSGAIEIAPSIQNDMVMEGKSSIELHFDVLAHQEEIQQFQLPFYITFRDFESRQRFSVPISLTQEFKADEWSEVKSEIPLQLKPSPNRGFVLADTSQQIKVSFAKEAFVKSVLLTADEQKIFYQKNSVNGAKNTENPESIESNESTEKNQEVLIPLPSTTRSTLYSLIIEHKDGALQEKALCLENALPVPEKAPNAP